MEDKLVTIASFANYIEADLAKQALEDFGIKSLVTGQSPANIYGEVLGLINLDLQVFESQVQRAHEILELQVKEEQ